MQVQVANRKYNGIFVVTIVYFISFAIGIGYETARILAGRGARVIIADKENLEETQDRIIWETHNKNIHSKYLDLEHLDSVREFAGEIRANERRLDVLINNAGVGGMVHRYTDDLLQVEMEINHFSPFLLTHLLIGLNLS